MNTLKYWIEKSDVKGQPHRQTGEYGLGRALLSPQTRKDGADIYHFMRDVQPDDIILHLTDDSAITGISRAAKLFEELEGVPPVDKGQLPVYLVQLRDFVLLDPPLSRDVFFNSPYRERLLALKGMGFKNLFYNRELNLNQGAYLTPAPIELVMILNDAYRNLTGRWMSGLPDEAQPSQLHILPEATKVRESPSVPIRPEKVLLDYIKHYVTSRGYYFDDETLYNYHICLKTRPFVILAGLSGTGKSKLSQLYAEAIGYTTENGCYLRLPVRPSWNDDRYLLGYFNSITGEYVTEPAIDFLMRAENDQQSLYFFCLDEMNLAHVEYYFSQFLSAMEEENPESRRILLLSQRTRERLAVQGGKVGVPYSVLIPPNLLFTGTVNVDETTQPLSDKVMDRANTIEFFAVDLDKIPMPKPLPPPVPVPAANWFSYQSRQPDTAYRSWIVDINKILNKGDMGIGYRVLREIELYLANSRNLLDPQTAFDLQVKQRILPRVRGTKAIEGVINELLTFLSSKDLGRAAGRLREMQLRLNRDGYVNFWR